ncbi:MAG TPA: cupredoxin domain-containing protein [Vicinamibacterales bacterium]|nr:cupredoxin domain-containing protein [Vicinamibacterales bacterium]
MLCVLLSRAAAGDAQPPQRRVIRITAERFTFTPSEIVVEPGEEIEFRLKSDDTAHGFRIAGTPVNVVIPKRGRAEMSVTFRAGEAGRYVFECSRMCGAGHNFMRGVLVVRDRTSRATGQ